MLDFTITLSTAQLDDTGVDKSAKEILAGLQDCKVGLTCAWNNTATTGSVPVLLTSDHTVARTVVIPMPGGTGATITYTGLIIQTAVTRAAGGKLEFKADIDLSNGTLAAWS